ncbi:DNA-binding protein [Olivibacter sp. LS-1]|nr:DNA-binding protein [Olivibacter sp. LS-1]
MNIQGKGANIRYLLVCMMFMLPFTLFAQQKKLPINVVHTTSADSSKAKPWVFWYWMHSAYSKEGITADLEAMKEIGISGAYLAPIKGKTDPPLYEPVIETMTPAWWDLIRFTLEEADRVGIKLALLPGDGFATAGGSWISPELSMQKVVWADTVIAGGKDVRLALPQPEAYQGYYRDIATFALPVKDYQREDNQPTVSTSTRTEAQFLTIKGNKKNFSSKEPCWIQYTYKQPYTCRAIQIEVEGFNYQSGRLIIQTSNDGVHFQEVSRLKPPRAGWLDWDVGLTHAIEPITARYFRFVYDPEGSEPGGEDLDAAKWKPSLKLSGIHLLSTSRIHQYEGKSGVAWRISEPSTSLQIADTDCIKKDQLINISSSVQADGTLTWKAPSGVWKILRMGHTSTGHMNETAGNGKGLECDKMNPKAVEIQLQGWLQKAIDVAGDSLARQVLKIFHVDSWECGSQNWSPVFRNEFKRRRGYDPVDYLPAMAGYPIASADFSERYLYDIRQTIAEVVNTNFFEPIKAFTHKHGAVFSAETTAPVMLTDGMAHFKTVDIPMGEFWLRSPSHDKFNDVLDAVSGAHIYGKPLVQAEAFTQIRMEWDEHPGNLKTLQDRNYALGVNRLVYHIYVHNPWLNRKPGMTLSSIGLYFQRDQTWWKQGKAWVDYATRVQQLLQAGTPVTDLAVFTGEELPRRAILPDRMVSTLPGIFGEKRVLTERARLANKGLPIQKIAGVSTSANMVQPEDWINALRGYAYDSLNPDILLQAKVEDGRIVLPTGAAYGILVLPGRHALQPNDQAMSLEVARKLKQLITEGAKVVLSNKPLRTLGLSGFPMADTELNRITALIWDGSFEQMEEGDKSVLFKKLGKGMIIKAPYLLSSFNQFGVQPDVHFSELDGSEATGLGFNHRRTDEKDIYFLTNQREQDRKLLVSFRVAGKVPYLYDPVSNIGKPLGEWRIIGDRTEIPLQFAHNASLFVLFKEETNLKEAKSARNWPQLSETKKLMAAWHVEFNPDYGGPKKAITLKELKSWSEFEDTSIRNYSGTAHYRTTFQWKGNAQHSPVWLQLEEVANIATIKVNGVDCGTLWTAPYRVDIGKTLRKGENQLEIAVTNTWANRLIGDQALPMEKRITQTTAPFRLEGQPLLKAGLIGTVRLMEEEVN